jgi:hypothetical protein
MPFIKVIYLHLIVCSADIPQPLYPSSPISFEECFFFGDKGTKGANYLLFSSYFNHNNFLTFNICSLSEFGPGLWLAEPRCKPVQKPSYDSRHAELPINTYVCLFSFFRVAAAIREMAFQVNYFL